MERMRRLPLRFLGAGLLLLLGAGLLGLCWSPSEVEAARGTEGCSSGPDDFGGTEVTPTRPEEAARSGVAPHWLEQSGERLREDPSDPRGSLAVAVMVKVQYEDGSPVTAASIRHLVLRRPATASGAAAPLPAIPLPGSVPVASLDGEIRLPASDAGQHLLQVWPQDGLPVEVCLQVPSVGPAPQVVRVVRAVTVRGVVSDAKDNPIAGAWVAMADDGEAGAVTEADGSFALPPLPPRRYVLRVEAAGHAALEREVDCELGRPLELRLRLMGNAVVSGRVQPWRHGAEEQFSIEIVDVRGCVRAVTVKDGSYQIEGLAPGMYEVRVQPRGGDVRAYVTSLVVGAGPGRTLQVHAGQHLHLDLPNPVAALAQIRGQALGHPTNTRVEIVPLDMETPPASLLQVLRGGLDASGAFDFGAVPAGRLLVRLLDARGALLVARQVTVTPGGMQALDLSTAQASGAR